jgi:hypothetical protein
MTRLGRRGLIATGVALLVAATAGATALAVTSHGADRNNRAAAGATARGHAAPIPATAVVHHWSIASSGFAPDHINPGSSNDYFNRWDSSLLTDNGNRCFNAGVFLPNGVTIRSVTFYYTNGATHDFYGELNRQYLAGRTSRILASITTTPGTTPKPTHKKVAVTGGGVVDTSHFAYGLGVCPQNDSAFTGATIAFTG